MLDVIRPFDQVYDSVAGQVNWRFLPEVTLWFWQLSFIGEEYREVRIAQLQGNRPNKFHFDPQNRKTSPNYQFLSVQMFSRESHSLYYKIKAQLASVWNQIDFLLGITFSVAVGLRVANRADYDDAVKVGDCRIIFYCGGVFRPFHGSIQMIRMSFH